MANCKDNLNIVLIAYVNASAKSDTTYVWLHDIATEMGAGGVHFTDGANSEPMTDRASKLVLGTARKRYILQLQKDGVTDDDIETEINDLGLKKVKSAPPMSEKEGFDFGAFRAKLNAAAKKARSQ